MSFCAIPQGCVGVVTSAAGVPLSTPTSWAASPLSRFLLPVFFQGPPQLVPPTRPQTGRRRPSPATGAACRKRLYDAGVQADLVYTPTTCATTPAACKRGGAYMGHVDLVLQFDGEKLFGWQGGSAYLQWISNSGGQFNLNYVGSLMGVDNLEAPVNRTGVFKAWLQQSFLDDQASLRVGLYPIDSEFYVTDSSGVFLHPSFGMAAEVGQFRQPGRSLDLCRRVPMARACGSTPIRPGTPCWPSRVAFRAIGSPPPAPMSVGRTAAAAC
jgi:hypothetical protein